MLTRVIVAALGGALIAVVFQGVLSVLSNSQPPWSTELVVLCALVAGGGTLYEQWRQRSNRD